MAAVEEEIRIPQDPHRAEKRVFREDQPQESTQTDERAGHPCGPRRPRQEILLLQREGRQDGTEHTRKRLPCRCLPPEGGDGRHGIQVRLGQGLFLPCHRFPQRQDPCLYALGEPEQEDGSGHAFQAAPKVPKDKTQDPAFRPGLAVPEACLPEETRGIRDHTVDVEKGELPGQRKDGEPVLQAEEGDVLKAGCVYVARGGKHLNVITERGSSFIHYSDEPNREGVKPCANYMYESLAKSSYDQIVCVVMTGMGADGTVGVTNLKKDKKIHVIAQQEDSCAVYGMPKNIVKAGLADQIVDLDDIAQEIIMNVGVK